MRGLKTKIHVKDIGWPEALLGFFTVFMFSFGFVFYLNIIWVFYFLYLLMNKRVMVHRSNALFFLLAFIILGLISVITYNTFYYHFELRQFIGIIFSTQYIFLTMDIFLNKDKLERWTVFFAVILCALILFLFISRGYYRNPFYWGGLDRTWGRGVIPGFPTNVVIPLVYALYLCVKKKFSIVLIFVISLATLMIPSRIGQLSVFFVLLLYFYKSDINKRVTLVFLFFAVFLLVLSVSNLGSLFLKVASNLMSRYGKGSNADRNDIYWVVFQYFKLSPLIGYGGNTLDTLYTAVGNFSLYNIQWPHAHNWFLEFLIRYGILATSCFCAFISCVCKRAIQQKNLFFCCMLLGCGLFETYMQTFTFIFILMNLVSIKQFEETTRMKAGT